MYTTFKAADSFLNRSHASSIIKHQVITTKKLNAQVAYVINVQALIGIF
jgi:hypothetical protein